MYRLLSGFAIHCNAAIRICIDFLFKSISFILRTEGYHLQIKLILQNFANNKPIMMLIKLEIIYEPLWEFNIN